MLKRLMTDHLLCPSHNEDYLNTMYEHSSFTQFSGKKPFNGNSHFNILHFQDFGITHYGHLQLVLYRLLSQLWLLATLWLRNVHSVLSSYMLNMISLNSWWSLPVSLYLRVRHSKVSRSSVCMGGAGWLWSSPQGSHF